MSLRHDLIAVGHFQAMAVAYRGGYVGHLGHVGIQEGL